MATSARLWMVEKDNLPRAIICFKDAETREEIDGTGCTAKLVYRLNNEDWEERGMIPYEIEVGKFYYQFESTDLTSPGVLCMQAKFIDATGRGTSSKRFYRDVLMSCFDEVEA